MKRDGHNNVAFFIGPEVEHTPAYSKKTLFVVGKQDIKSILKHATEHKVTHIFMGANHSFDASIPVSPYWNETIIALLDKGFWVTLEYEAHLHKAMLSVLNPATWLSRMFVPLLSVRIPSIHTTSSNLTVKIDDVDFNATNPGVWCMHFKEVTDSNRFTDWTEYGSDLIITQEQSTPAVTVQTEVKNQTELGLDPDSKSLLKPEYEETKVSPVAFIKSPTDAAEAYAEGAKTDPLSAKESTKKAKAKK